MEMLAKVPKLLGCVTVEMVSAKEISVFYDPRWIIFSWIGKKTQDEIFDLCALDVRWKSFILAHEVTPPPGAKVMKYDGAPLRFNRAREPIDPTIRQADRDDVENPEWANAPIEADLYCLPSKKDPVYKLNVGENRIATKFETNDAQFFVVMRMREKE